MDKRETIRKVKKLVEENKLEEASIELKIAIVNENDLDSLIVLLSRIKEVNQKEIRGTANFQEINIEKNRIRDSILGLANKANEDVKNEKLDKSIINKKNKIIEELKNEIEKLREEYKSNINDLESEVLRYLTNKYKYGFIVFGILDGKFIYTPSKKIMNATIEADWNETNISIDGISNSYVLNISNLKWTYSIENRSTTTTKTEKLTCLLPSFPKEKHSYNLRAPVMFYQPNLYFETIKNSNNENIYILGFKQKEINEI